MITAISTEASAMAMPRGKKTAIQLRVSAEDAIRLDAWRGSVSQAEAARQLILLGLAHCPCAACKGLRENPVLGPNYHTDEKA